MAVDLSDLPLVEVKAHRGEGMIRFSRVWEASTFRGPWEFVDYAELPPGSSIGEHTHGNNEELYIILEGEGVMRLDGHEFRVRKGSLIRNRPGGTHGLRNDRPSPLKVLVVEVRT
jgi:mannose-6-phosphate isomerase-like protein (cupin superfamily)